MPKLSAKKAEALLIAYASTMPQAWEDHPWDHTVFKAGKKIFVFFGGAAGAKDELSITVKLPISAEMALTLPYMEPAGHGLWKSGTSNPHCKRCPALSPNPADALPTGRVP